LPRRLRQGDSCVGKFRRPEFALKCEDSRRDLGLLGGVVLIDLAIEFVTRDGESRVSQQQQRRGVNDLIDVNSLWIFLSSILKRFCVHASLIKLSSLHPYVGWDARILERVALLCIPADSRDRVVLYVSRATRGKTRDYTSGRKIGASPWKSVNRFPQFLRPAENG